MTPEEAAFKDVLEPGEQLLWVGRPGQGLRIRPADRWAIPFTVFWAGFWVFWEYWALGQSNWFFRLWGIPFLIVGAWFAVGRFFTDARRRARAQYGLTDRRIVVRLAGKRPSVESIGLPSIPTLTVVEHRDGSGDIVLGAGDNQHVAVGGLKPKRSSVLPMLEFLPNPWRVHEIINSARSRAV
jgi:hypothetical protein